MSQAAIELAELAAQQRRRAYELGDCREAGVLIGLAGGNERMAERLQNQRPSCFTRREDARPPAPVGIERGLVRERDDDEPATPHDTVQRQATSCRPEEATILAAIKRATGGISAQELGAAAHIDPRAARALVAHLRADHREPICSTPAAGYFWPRTAESCNSTLAGLESRRIEIEAAISGIRSGAVKEFGTGDLFGIPQSA